MPKYQVYRSYGDSFGDLELLGGPRTEIQLFDLYRVSLNGHQRDALHDGDILRFYDLLGVPLYLREVQ